MESRVTFGADGIRGLVNRFPFKRGYVLPIGKALAIFARRRHPGHATVALGRDTRASGVWIMDELITGLVAQGVDVLNLGVIPTPVAAFLVQRQDATLGVVVSASHSSYDYNGIKVIGRHGWRLQRDDEMELEALIAECCEDEPSRSDYVGELLDARHLTSLYVSHHVQLPWHGFGLDDNRPLAGCRIVMDCADGAVSTVAPAVFRGLGADVYALRDALDGDGINHQCGSEYARSHPDELARAVAHYDARFALAFDGDGDRLTVVDQDSNAYDGNDLLYVLACHFDAKEQLRQRTIVTSELANRGLEASLAVHGIRTVYANKGDRNIERALWKAKYLLGGEEGGNVIFNDQTHTAADATFTALVTCAILHSRQATMRALTADLAKYPRILHSLRIPFTLELSTRVRPLVRQYQAALGEQSRVLIWAASTEPGTLRFLVEGGPDSVRAHVEQVADAIRAELLARLS